MSTLAEKRKAVAHENLCWRNAAPGKCSRLSQFGGACRVTVAHVHLLRHACPACRSVLGGGR